MADTSLAKKLVIKPHYHILLINAPEGYRAHMGELPEGVTVTSQGDGPFDMVQAFAEQRAGLEEVAPLAIRAVKPDGLLWLTYPKRSGAPRGCHRGGCQALAPRGRGAVSLLPHINRTDVGAQFQYGIGSSGANICARLRAGEVAMDGEGEVAVDAAHVGFGVDA